jgi:hypothetical protein
MRESGFALLWADELRSEWEVVFGEFMRRRKRTAIALLVVALVLFVFQAEIWSRSSHVRTETVEQNLVIQHPPSEMPGLVGLGLLVVAAIVAATPQHSKDQRPHGMVGSKSQAQ